MAVGEELGVGYVTLTVSTKGMGREITKEFKQAEGKAKRTGQNMGREVSEGFEDTLDLDDLAHKVRQAEAKATREIEKATAEQAKAKKALEDAQARVTAETEKQAQAQAAAVERSTERQAKATARVALEERRLSAARVKSQNSTKARVAAENQLQSVMSESADDAAAVAKAQTALDRAREKSADDAVRFTQAEQNLAAAKREAVSADGEVTKASQAQVAVRRELTDAVGKAQREYESAGVAARWAASSENELQKELRETQTAYRVAAEAAEKGGQDSEQEYRSGWRGLAQRLGQQVSGAVSQAMGRVDTAGRGFLHGKAYSEGFERGVGRLNVPAPRMAGAAAMGALAGTANKMSGLRAVGDMGQVMNSVFANMDRHAVAAATLGLKIGGISSAAFGATGALLAMGSGLGSMAAAGLALPGLLAGVAVGAITFSTAMKDLATVLPDVAEAYGGLGSVISDNFWERAAGPVREAAFNLLPVLSTGLSQVAYQFGGWAVAISSVVGSAEGLSWVSQVLDNVRHTADGMGDGIGSLTHGLLELTAVGSTYLPQLGSAMTGLFYTFENFVSVNTENGNIFRWIDGGIQQFKYLGQTIGGIFGIFGSLHKASAAAGGPTGFGFLASGVQAVNEALKGPMWQGALTSAFKGAYDSMSLIGRGIQSMLPDLAAFMPTLGTVMRLSGETIGAMIDSLGDLLSHPAVQGGLVNFFTSVRDATTQLAPSAGLLGDAFGAIATMAGKLFFAVSGTLDAALKAVAPAFLQISEGASDLIPALSGIVQTIISGMGPAFMMIGTAVGAVIGVIAGALTWLSQFDGVLRAVGFVVGGLAAVLAGPLMAAITAYRLAMIGLTIQTNLATLGITRQSIATTLAAAKQKVVAAATWAWTIAQRALNLAMRMNPIGLVITGLIALGAAVVVMYNRVGWFKDGVQAAWAGIKAAAAGVATWFMTYVWPTITNVLQWIGDKFVWLWANAILPAFTWIRGIISGFVTWFTTVALPWIQNALSVLGQAFTWLYNNVIQPVWYGIRVAIAMAVAIVMTIFDGIVWFVRDVLAPVFTWLWHNVIVPAFNGIVNAGRVLWNGLKVVFDFIRGIIQNVVAPVITWLWHNVFSPAFSAIGRIVSGAWNNVIKPTFDFLKQGLTWVGDRASALRQRWNLIWAMIRSNSRAAFEFISDRVFNPLKQALSWVGDRFSAIRSRIAEIWSDLRLKLFWGYIAIRDKTFVPLKNAATNVRERFGAVRDRIGEIWQNLRQRLFDGFIAIRDRTFTPLKNAATNVRERFGAVRDRIGEIWRDLRKKLYDGYVAIKDRTFGPLREAANKVKDTFDEVKEGIRKSWEKLKDAVKAPVKFVVETVVNKGLIENFNKVAKTFGVKEISKLSLPEGFRKGGWTGNKPKDEVAGVVHGRENVTNAESSASIERAAPGYMERLNKYGAKALGSFKEALPPGMPRDPDKHLPPDVHAAGGKGRNGVHFGGQRPIWGPLQDAIRRTGELNVSSSASHFPVSGAAADLKKASNIDVKMGGAGANSVRVQESNTLPGRPGWVAGYYSGQRIQLRIGSVSSAATKKTLTRHELGHALGLQHAMASGARSMMNYNNQYQHNSITQADVNALSQIWGGKGEPVAGAGGGGGGGGFSLVPNLLGAIGFDKMLDRIPGGPFVVDIMKGVAGKIWEGFKSFAADKLNPFDDGGGNPDNEKVDISKAIEKWRPNVTAALKREGLPSNKTWQDAWLRQVRTESNGNPNAVQQVRDQNWPHNKARGLVQVIPPTFKAHRNPSLPNNQFNPDASLSAGMRWAKHKYGIDKMLNHVGIGKGYSIGDRGGRSLKSLNSPGWIPKANKGIWDDPVGTVQSLRPGMNAIYNGTGRVEHFERVESTPTSSADMGRAIALLEQIANADRDITVQVGDKTIYEAHESYKRRARIK